MCNAQRNNEKFKDLEHWNPGFAPCSLWTKPVGEWSWDWREEVHGWTREKIFSCGTNNLQYTITANYTEFREADIIYFDYPFYDYIGKPPFWDNRRMPPRIAHQKWVLKFGRESTAYYPQVALASYLQQFDFTMGAPDPQFDLSYPLYPVSEVEILQLANVKPVFPVDKKPENYIAWMISNCTPKNNRNEIMKELMEKIGAHSYGSCQNNRKGPSEEETKGRPWEQVKQEILAAYPFTLVAENSNCIGYITEKIYDAFAAGVVPLYMGAVDIADYVPRSSFVAIQDFEDVDSLVEYMKTVDRSQFFEWKEEVKKDYSSFCKKCHRGKETLECRVLDNVHHV
ncbi:4-alpha-L-fucosyltransferase [Haplosporangium sp. Z 27]|nr:4-alpha-L-fucosyltransferase [Haplosporangium sp. Z 27]